MIATLATLGAGHATKLGGPQDDRVLQQASLLEVLDQGRDGCGHAHGERTVVLGDVLVGIPIATREAVVVARPNLDEAHPSLNQATGGQAFPTHDVGFLACIDFGGPLLGGVVDSVVFLDPGGFLREVQRLRCRQLHAGGQFIGADASL